MEMQINQDELKNLLKVAIVEVLEERRDLISDIIEESLEDVAMARAIAEGNNSDSVDRNEIFKILER